MANQNLLKSSWIIMNHDDARIIDNNELADARISAALQEEAQLRAVRSQPVEDEFGELPAEAQFEGLDPDQLALLTEDQGAFSDGMGADGVPGEESGFQEGAFDGTGGAPEDMPPQQMSPEPDPALLEAAQAQADELLQGAQAQADELVQNAQAQADQILSEAREEGLQQGISEGRAQAVAQVQEEMAGELETRRQELETEYQKQLDALEPEMVDALTKIYEHVFSVDLAGEKNIILHLLQTTLSRIEPNGDFMIHVSPDDYDMMLDEKDNLRKQINSPNAVLEIVEDPLLKENECMIETDGGIFDCSLGVELSEVSRKLKLLAFDRRRN